MVLSVAVTDQLDKGLLSYVHLIKFDLPGKVVSYVHAPRPLVWDGVTYLPNRYLDMADYDAQLGNSVTDRVISFSNVPTSNSDDAIAALETYDYPNAPVTITTLLGAPGTNEPLGLLSSSTYEIDSVSYPVSAMDENGERTVTVQITLQPPGRTARDSTQYMRTAEEQAFHNSATDTAIGRAKEGRNVVRKFGRRSS